MPRSKLEGRMTVSSAWVISVTDSGGTDAAITVAVGDYYLTSATSLLTALQTALNASGTLAGTYTVSLADDTDAATGKVTISATGGGNIAITWTNTSLRDRLGFTGNVSGATSHTGTEQAEYLFLPNCARDSKLKSPDGDAGIDESDLVISLGSDGTMVSTQSVRRVMDSLGYGALIGSKSFTSLEVTANESLQKFWIDVLSAGRPFRYHKDRFVDGTYVTWRAVDAMKLALAPVVPGWYGANSLFAWSSDVRKEI